MICKFRKSFEKDIDKISEKDVLRSIARIIEFVESAETPKEIPNLKKLKGDKRAFRIRIGNYRLGIYIIGDVIEFTRVLPRDKIYEYFPD